MMFVEKHLGVVWGSKLWHFLLYKSWILSNVEIEQFVFTLTNGFDKAYIQEWLLHKQEYDMHTIYNGREWYLSFVFLPSLLRCSIYNG